MANIPKPTVDVLSPHDRPVRVAVRVAQLLNRGVQLVWIVDPEAREVCVHRRGRDPCIVKGDEKSPARTSCRAFAAG